MKKPETTERLLYLIGFVQEAQEQIDAECGNMPASTVHYSERDAWWLKRKEAIEKAKRRLEEEGAVFTYRPPHSHAIRLAGIRSGSTSGWTGALYNWRRAAEKRVAEQAAASHERA